LLREAEATKPPRAGRAKKIIGLKAMKVAELKASKATELFKRSAKITKDHPRSRDHSAALTLDPKGVISGYISIVLAGQNGLNGLIHYGSLLEIP
jgi:hypothetical protein